MALDAGASGGTSGARQKVARQTTIRARPAPRQNIERQTTMTPKPPVRSNSTGNYSGGGGGSPSRMSVPQAPPPMRQGRIQGVGNGGGRRGAVERRASKPDPRPKAPGLKKYLAGDETYQSQLSSLQKELEDYILANEDQRGDLTEDFGLSQERMAEERTKALDSMKNDFAARGLLESSEFMDAIGDYDTSYQTKLGDLSRDRDRGLEDLLESLGMYRRTNKNELQNARAEAIRRRAEQFGLGG